MQDYPRVVVLGSSGMLGTYICDVFRENRYHLFVPSRFDARVVTDQELREALMFGGTPTVVINCIGLIKQVSAPEADFFTVNSIFPFRLASLCEGLNIPLVHISTDCVFDGKCGKYTESFLPNALDVYGISKAKGEPSNATVIRTSIIGSERKGKRSLLEWVKSKDGDVCDGYLNHIWNGVTALQLARFIEGIVRSGSYWQGVRHYHSPDDVSKYELVRALASEYGINVSISPVDAPNACDRTLRSIVPFESPPNIETQIKLMREWDRTHY